MSRAAQLGGMRVSSSRGRVASWVDPIIVTLVLFAVAAAAAVVFLITIGMIRPEQLLGNEPLRQAIFGRLQAVAGLDRALLAAAAALVGMAAVTILLRRFSGPGVTISRHILSSDERGTVLVASTGISSVAEGAVMRVSGVVETEVKVSGSGRAPVRLRVIAHVFGSDDLKRIGDEVRAAARLSVERLIGVDVADVTVDVKVLRPEELDREIY